MLKKIPVRQLRVGMHLHKLEGPWISHPFWKSRFVIADGDELSRVRDCGVAECWIDTARGIDVASDTTAVSAPPAVNGAKRVSPAPPPVFDAGPRARAAEPPERAMTEELRQAAAICGRGRDSVAAMFAEARMGRTVDAEGCLPLVEDISASVQRNPGALVSLARLKTADDYSYMHSVAVCAMMISLARQLGLADEECRAAGVAGLMHDIGKAVMPLEVLNKPGRLTDEEFTIIRGHPAKGHAILVDGRGVAPETLDVVMHHHERMDGTGYPRQLPGEAISRFARMGAVCDVYDAITSNRPYKAGWDPAESIARMASWAGHFDPEIFSAFVQNLGIYPVGSLVRLESARLAIVSEQNPQKLVAPVVKVFFSLRQQLRVTPKLLDLSAPGCNDRIVGRHSREGPDGKFSHLDELWADPEVLKRAKRAD